MIKYFLSAVVIVGSAWATNGYFTSSPSVIYKGLAGAGVAHPKGIMASGQNPAAAAFVDDGISAGLSIFSPDRNITVLGKPSPGARLPLAPGKVVSSRSAFYVPAFAYNKAIDKSRAFSLMLQANGGMNTEYPASIFPGSTAPTGVDLSQLLVMPSYAHKVNEGQGAWGISPVFALQRFEMLGLETFANGAFSSSPTDVTNQGHDYSLGLGIRFGYIKHLNKKWNFGLTWQPKIRMSRFDSYKGLFAENGDFDIPENYNFGFTYRATQRLTWIFDIQSIKYSDVLAIGAPLSNLTVGGQLLGSSQGPGFGWQDMTAYKLGLEWQKNEKTTWRLGYSTGDQPIGPSEVLFNILAPGVIEEHVSVGYSRAIDTECDLDLAITHALSSSVAGPHPMDPAQTIILEMDQWEYSIAYSMKY
jgi:long-chain fatty acid transport protein